jgi:hypothetical protein
MNNFFPEKQTWHFQSSGRQVNSVPEEIFWRGSPFSGSYTCPHIVHTYLSIKYTPGWFGQYRIASGFNKWFRLCQGKGTAIIYRPYYASGLL